MPTIAQMGPVAIAMPTGFVTHAGANVEALVRENEECFLEAWHEFFDD